MHQLYGRQVQQPVRPEILSRIRLSPGGRKVVCSRNIRNVHVSGNEIYRMNNLNRGGGNGGACRKKARGNASLIAGITRIILPQFSTFKYFRITTILNVPLLFLFFLWYALFILLLFPPPLKTPCSYFSPLIEVFFYICRQGKKFYLPERLFFYVHNRK